MVLSQRDKQNNFIADFIAPILINLDFGIVYSNIVSKLNAKPTAREREEKEREEKRIIDELEKQGYYKPKLLGTYDLSTGKKEENISTILREVNNQIELARNYKTPNRQEQDNYSIISRVATLVGKIAQQLKAKSDNVLEYILKNSSESIFMLPEYEGIPTNTDNLKNSIVNREETLWEVIGKCLGEKLKEIRNEQLIPVDQDTKDKNFALLRSEGVDPESNLNAIYHDLSAICPCGSGKESYKCCRKH